MTYGPPPPRARANAAVIITVAFAGLTIIAGVAVAVVVGQQPPPTPPPADRASEAVFRSASPSPTTRKIQFEVTGSGIAREIHWQVGYDQAATDDDAPLPWKHTATPSADATGLDVIPVSVIANGDRNQKLTCRIKAGAEIVAEASSDGFVTCNGNI